MNLPENFAHSSMPSFTPMESHSEQIGGGHQNHPPYPDSYQTSHSHKTHLTWQWSCSKKCLQLSEAASRQWLWWPCTRWCAQFTPRTLLWWFFPRSAGSAWWGTSRQLRICQTAGGSSQGQLEVPGGVPPDSSLEFSRCSVSHERLPVGPRDPPFMQEVFQAPCDVILPPAPLINMQQYARTDPIRSAHLQWWMRCLQLLVTWCPCPIMGLYGWRIIQCHAANQPFYPARESSTRT
jgi:hypothetical protein